VLAGVRDAVAPLRIADPISFRLDVRMAPKYHPTPLSGGDREALAKELGKARAMANILAAQSAEIRAKGEAMVQQADRLLCESWNERMWSDGEPIDPSPSIDQAVNGGFPWLEIRCARCKTPSDVDLAAMRLRAFIAGMPLTARTAGLFTRPNPAGWTTFKGRQANDFTRAETLNNLQ